MKKLRKTEKQMPMETIGIDLGNQSRRQFIFQLERGLFGKRGNRRFSPSRFCVSRGCWTRARSGLP